MNLKNEAKWKEYVDANNDEYGGYCVKVAKRVMEILDEDPTPLHSGYNPDMHTPHGIICKADDDVNAGGITGFMAQQVTLMVYHCHVRGEEFWDASENTKRSKLEACCTERQPDLDKFEKELTHLINSHGLENYYGNTPDYILAEHIMCCLSTLRNTLNKRDTWYSVHLEPGNKLFMDGKTEIDDSMITDTGV